MASSFAQGMRKLAARVGEKNISAEFWVDGGGRTVPLEAGYWVNHMGRNGRVAIRNYTDGGPHATQRALTAAYQRTMQDAADGLYTEGLRPAMVRHLMRMQDYFEQFAPRVTGSYHESTFRAVRDPSDGRFVWTNRGAFYGREPRP